MVKTEHMIDTADTYLLRLHYAVQETINILEVYDNYMKAFEYDKYHFTLSMNAKGFYISTIITNTNFTNLFIKTYITNIYKNNKFIIDDINKIKLNEHNVHHIIQILQHNNNNVTFEFIKLLNLSDKDWLLISSHIVLTFEFARKFKKNISWANINYISEIDDIDFGEILNSNNYTIQFYIEFQKYIPTNVFRQSIKQDW